MMQAMHQWFRNRSLNGKLILVFSLPVLFLVVVAVTTLAAFRDFEKAEELVQQSNRIRSQAIFYLDVLFSTQNAFRGFLLTGDRSFLATFNESKGDLDLAGHELIRVVQFSPSQVQHDRVANVQVTARQLLQEKDRVIARVKAGFQEEGIAYIKSGRGRTLAEEISSQLVDLEREAAKIQKDRLELVARKRALLLNVMAGGTVLTLLLTGLGVVVVARSITRPMAALAEAAVQIGESGHAMLPDADRLDEVGALSRSMDEMQQRLVPAERLAALTRVATSIAHDLRTPLVGIERGLQGLQYEAGESLNPDARQLLGDLYNGARLAVGVVQDILDLYRQAYGELPLSYSRFPLAEVAQEVVDLLRSEIKDRRLSVSVHAPVLEVSADRRRLVRVMVNLLDNAVKNSPAGGCVRIIVSEKGGGSARRAVMAVEDEGRGLEPGTLETLFEPNRPVSAPTRSGTGLGLYLCRLVIGAHRGTLTAQNRPEGGARFVFEIPVEVNHGDTTVDCRRPAAVQTEPAHRP